MRVELAPVRGGPLAGFYELRFEKATDETTLPSLNMLQNYVKLSQQRLGNNFRPVVTFAGMDDIDTLHLDSLVLLLRDQGYVVRAVLDGTALPRWARSATIRTVELSTGSDIVAEEFIWRSSDPAPDVRGNDPHCVVLLSTSAKPTDYLSAVLHNPGWRVIGPKAPTVELQED